MQAKRTDPAPKYGPTKAYGGCEAAGCEANARTTCADCAGEFCLGHAQHAVHDAEVSVA